MRRISFGARTYNASIGRFDGVDPLASIAGSFSPFVYTNNNPLVFIDPDGMASEDFTYSDGYSNLSAKNSTGSVGFNGAYQNCCNNQEPIKGGYPNGTLGPASQQNATVSQSKSNNFTPEEKAAHLGVEIAWTVEGGFGLIKLGKSASRLLSFSKYSKNLIAPLKNAESLLSLGKKFGPLNPGPLVTEVTNSFRSATYTEKVVETEMIVYRYWGGKSGEFGRFWSPAPNGPLASQIDSAILPEWGNTFQNLTHIRVPKGTIYYEGIAAGQKSAKGELVGGGTQIYFNFNVNPLWKMK